MSGRHAYLITAYDDFYVLDRLVILLSDSRNDIFLHVDKKSRSFDAARFAADHKSANLTLVPRRKVYWGDYTHVESILQLLAVAKRCGNYDYFHLLSGSDLPLKTQDDIHAFFAANQGKEFVAFNEMPPRIVEWASFSYPLNRYRRSHKRLVRSSSGRIRTLSLGLQKRLKADRTKRIKGELKYGSDWFSISDEFATLLLKRKKTIKRWFGRAFIPSEFFAQTLLWNSVLRERIFDLDNPYRSSMRLIDFSRGTGASPYTFRTADFEELVTAERLFARKFDSRLDQQVVDKLSQHILSQARPRS